MRLHAYGWLAIVGAVTAAQVPRDARACSPPIPYLVSQRIVAPANGAMRVPLNAVVTLAYTARLGMSTVPLDHPALRSAASATIVTPLTPLAAPTLFASISPTLLAPNMRYEVLSEIPNVPCFGADSPGRTPPCWPTATTPVAVDGGALDAGEVDGGAATVSPAAIPLRGISYFTTGDATDESPPTSPGPLTINKAATSCHDSACCFDYEGFGVRVDWAPAQDDTGIGYYEITAPDGEIMLQTVTWLQTIIMCSAQGTFGGMDTPGKYQLVAVDLAGHRSPPVTIDLDTCDRGCGCHLGAPGRSAALGTCLILSLLLLASRRSRRSKSSIPPP